ncbi:MAG: hypothetical protein QQN55_08265 [Nitrosopumilus sp.]
MDKQDKIFEIADKITKFNFKEIWNMEGHAMENLSKKEVAEEMFFKGLAYMLEHLNNLQEIDIDEVKGKIKEAM